MKLMKSLNIHKCNKCSAPLDDCDFLRVGISVVCGLQWYFDFICPRCSARGRWVVDITETTSAKAALKALVKTLEDEKESTP